ncbi:MAG: family 4 glycosyl hydrolase [Promethearchaeota archaeon]
MKQKIVLIGAGSSVFGPSMFSDLYLSKLDGSTIVLVDIDAEKLEMIYDILCIENEQSGNKFVLERTTDRKDALRNATFVVSSVEPKRFHFRWQDHAVPLKYGARSRMGECGGPGGFFHSARIIPIVMDILKDVDEICPNAYFINFSNPVARISLAAHRMYPHIKFVGLCHQIEFLNTYLPRMFDCTLEELKLTVTGLNHFGFLIGLEKWETEEDLMPEFNRRCLEYFEGKWDKFAFDQFTFEIYRQFGYFPHPGDNHLCEYIQFADEFVLLEDLKEWIRLMEESGKSIDRKIRRYHKKLKQGKSPKKSLLNPKPSGEQAIPIIEAIVTGNKLYGSSVNIPNSGLVTNLPQDLVIETPAWIDGDGIHGIEIGDLPKNIAGLLRIEATIQDLCVEAILQKSKSLAINCLAMDTKVGSVDMAEKIFDDLYEQQKEFMPEFK